MHSYAAGEVVDALEASRARVHAYLFAALKVSATTCVVGAIIELPAGIQDGLGGAILNFNQYYASSPNDLWATNLVAAALGIFFFLVIVLGEHLFVRRAPERRMSEQSAVILLRGVRKEFARGGVVALQGIDLDIRPGEFVSLIGPSGCGKSTLLRVVGDLVQPTTGDVVVNGKPAGQARLDRDYGASSSRTPSSTTGARSRRTSRSPWRWRWDKRQRADRVREMIELVELTGFDGHHPWQLSGGMQQRVSIARALSFDPALLLMDEPFGALDEMTRERLNMELLEIWQRSGSTVVFVTHSISRVYFLSTRVVVMSARPGRITGIVDVDLAQPHAETREEPRFFELVTQVREQLRAGGADTAVEEAEDDLIAAEEGSRERRRAAPVQTVPRGSVGRLVGRGFRDWAPAASWFRPWHRRLGGLVRGLGVERSPAAPVGHPPDALGGPGDLPRRGTLYLQGEHDRWVRDRVLHGVLFLLARWRRVGRALAATRSRPTRFRS